MHLLNQSLLFGAVYPVEREHESKNEGVEEEVSPFTTTPIDPLEDFVLSVSATDEEHFLARRHRKTPQELQIMAAMRMPRSPLSQDQQAKRSFTTLVEDSLRWAWKLGSMYVPDKDCRPWVFISVHYSYCLQQALMCSCASHLLVAPRSQSAREPSCPCGSASQVENGCKEGGWRITLGKSLPFSKFQSAYLWYSAFHSNSGSTIFAFSFLF
ncbi:cytotoxic T-lymphocyte protein 4 isoform X8 [Acinonyx jubatus]|uniref:Cytotoxic T-lymphocyte protein 4 isoform X8 n=1 Tax=Acinonyx jubatus TaxID=32536 RepID=A0ABM3PIY2_ACIJB|nr:cytotoxic T-lymphocyte protein 4 isoform X8 [Acinonyx jubatus]